MKTVINIFFLFILNFSSWSQTSIPTDDPMHGCDGCVRLDRLNAEFHVNSKQKQHQQALVRAGHFPNTFFRVSGRILNEMLKRGSIKIAV